MRKLIWIFIAAVTGILGCSGPQSQYRGIIDRAESLVPIDADSALALLEAVDPADLTVDSIKAKYYFVMASAHNRQGQLMLADSLIRFSSDFYRDKDLEKNIRSATLWALYNYRIGENERARTILDSLSALENLPDSLLVFPLRKRAFLGKKISDDDRNLERISHLMEIDNDSARRAEYRYWQYIEHLFNGNNDSALAILNDLIARASLESSSPDVFRYEYEKVGVLEEMGRYQESLSLADKLLTKAPGNSVSHYLHFWKSWSLLNMGRRDEAMAELARADSCAAGISEDERVYYNSFVYFLKSVIDYRDTGKLKLISMAQINNTQKDNFFRTQAIQQEAEQSALEIENKRLTLKAKNDRQASIIIIVVLFTLLICGGLLWFAFSRRRKAMEALEKAEVLQNLVDELNTAETNGAKNETLRRAMLQQLGIIRMVAETPTEQNREMLRKISSVDSNDGALVNWENVYEIIDNLYGGFHSRLHRIHGDVLSEKEEQIIVLMMAGFSTKEISVLTNQSTATIYVRKSAIRKKLGVAEKEDIVAFLLEESAD